MPSKQMQTNDTGHSEKASVEQLVTQPVTAVTATVNKSNERVSVPADVSTFDVAHAIDKQSDNADNHAVTYIHRGGSLNT